jgi:hypothetical protein
VPVTGGGGGGTPALTPPPFILAATVAYDADVNGRPDVDISGPGIVTNRLGVGTTTFFPGIGEFDLPVYDTVPEIGVTAGGQPYVVTVSNNGVLRYFLTLDRGRSTGRLLVTPTTSVVIGIAA